MSIFCKLPPAKLRLLTSSFLFVSLDEGGAEEVFDPTESAPDEIAQTREDQRAEFALMRAARDDMPEPLKTVVEKICVSGWSAKDVERAYPTLRNRASKVLKAGLKTLTDLFEEKRKEAEARIIPFPGPSELPVPERQEITL